MKYIATDSRWIGNHGIGRYAAEVLSRLPEIKPLSLNGSPTSPFDPIRLSLALIRQKPTVFYNPGFNCPLFKYQNCVTTVHDLIHLVDEKQRSTAKTLYYEKILKPSLIDAPFVFTVSEQSKQQIVRWTQVDAQRVIVTPNGVSQEFIQGDPQLKSNNLLYVGSSRSHKNTKRMLEAFSLLGDSEIRLSWVGPISAEDVKLMHRLKIEGRVDLHQNLSNTQLAALYQKSRGTILVSTLEGFGLPPIESIFCGTPALISDNSPLANDLSEVAITVDPLNTDSIFEGLQRVLQKSFSVEDHSRIELLRKKYDWANTASIVYENLLRIL